MRLVRRRKMLARLQILMLYRVLIVVTALWGILNLDSYVWAADPPLKTYAALLKGKRFAMKAHGDLFGEPLVSELDQRLVQEATVFYDGEKPSISGHTDWLRTHFASTSVYLVKDVKYQGSKGTLQIKVWQMDSLSEVEPEIKLTFTGANRLTLQQFDELFFSIFLKPGESMEDYVRLNQSKLVESYFDTESELSSLSAKAKLDLLKAIQIIGLVAQPQLGRIGNALYVPAAVASESTAYGELTAYNDLQVSKNQRIASSIEASLGKFKKIASQFQKLPDGIKGIRFLWRVLHQSPRGLGLPGPLNYDLRTEQMEMFVPWDAMKEFSEGNLSAFELVQKSILRENGVKVTLTSYDPIGAK